MVPLSRFAGSNCISKLETLLNWTRLEPLSSYYNYNHLLLYTCSLGGKRPLVYVFQLVKLTDIEKHTPRLDSTGIISDHRW